MKKSITFHGMDHSDPMEKYANQQLEKIEQFLSEAEKEPIFINLTLEPSKLRAHHRVELRVKSPNYDAVSNYEGDDFYDVLDRVIDIMYRELLEEKKKRHDRLKTIGRHDEFKKQR